MAWLRELPYTLTLPFMDPPVLCVHAGLVPGVPLEYQSPLNMVKMRNIRLELDKVTSTRSSAVIPTAFPNPFPTPFSEPSPPLRPYFTSFTTTRFNLTSSGQPA